MSDMEWDIDIWNDIILSLFFCMENLSAGTQGRFLFFLLGSDQ